METSVLELASVSLGYKKSNVINKLSLKVSKGQKLGILGRNGVGKTTLMKGTIGLLPLNSGKILFDGQDISKLPAFERAQRGIAYVPQGREIFADLTVRENLELGALDLLKRDSTKTLTGQIKLVTDYFPELKNHFDRKGGVLSGGQQQQLSIARALMSLPKILLLDEPTDGIQPNVVDSLAATLNKIQKEMNISLVVVEQNLNFAKKIIDNFIIIQKGNIVSAGKKADLTDEVSSKYLSV